ncbi:MAG: SDR family NAD(P)-dependent oxidoreductase [Gammaproteobacteria bacterium]
MDLGLRGKRALVTGSSSGIGMAMAMALAREGAAVVVHGRDEARANAVARGISEYGRAAVALGDLASDAGAESVAAAAHTAFGGIDILVNNAGSYGWWTWENTTPQSWTDLLNENLISMVRMVRLLAPAMKSRGWGRLLQISSTAAPLGLPFAPEYGAGKAAVIHISSSLAKEYGPFGVTSNALVVGTVATGSIVDMVREHVVASGRSPDDPRHVYDAIMESPQAETVKAPIGRLGTPEEIGDIVTMLCSPRCDFINGATIRADGGRVPSLGI